MQSITSSEMRAVASSLDTALAHAEQQLTAMFQSQQTDNPAPAGWIELAEARRDALAEARHHAHECARALTRANR